MSRIGSAKLALLLLAISFSFTSRMETQVGTPPPALTNGFLRALNYFKNGNVNGATEELHLYLVEHSDDSRARYFLSRFDLQLGRRDEAIHEYNILKLSGKPDDKYTQTLEAIFKLDDQKRQLTKALADMQPAEAMRLTNDMRLPAREKGLIQFEINMAQGNLANALFTLATLRSTAPQGDAELDAMERDAKTSAQRFKEISDKIHWYLSSSLCTGSCTAKWARIELPKENYSLLEYMRVVLNAARLYPLNPWVQDLAFHAAMLSAPYEDFESFGDKLLEAKGSLRLPFYSKQSIFYVVIDAKRRRIYSEANSLMRSNESGSEDMADWIPFDLSFDEITEISQKAQADLSTGSLAGGSFALKFSPSGVAPNYSFMGLMQCLYGEAKQKEVTHNLGAYIAHVIHNDKVHFKLVDSRKLTRDWMASSTSALALGEMMAADYIRQTKPNEQGADMLAGNAMQIVSANAEQADKVGVIRGAQEEALGNWSHALMKRAFSAVEADRERLLAKDVADVIAKSGN